MTDEGLEIARVFVSGAVQCSFSQLTTVARDLLAEVDQLREANLKMLREMNRLGGCVEQEREAILQIVAWHEEHAAHPCQDVCAQIAAAIRQRGIP